jgi:3-hydroxybutyryl-CoA dehydratase
LVLSQQTQVVLDPWQLTPGWVAEYLAAVGNTLPVYTETGLVPPLAVAARTLGQLLDKLPLPAGAIHSLQELDVLRPIPAVGLVLGVAHLERPRQRGSLEFRTVAYSLRDGQDRALLNGKSTVLVVHSAHSAGSQEPPGGPAGRQEAAAPSPISESSSLLPAVSRTITQAQLDAYCRASGDFNPLHWDPQFAAGTQFGGTIAHGMLTLAFVAEMLAGAFGKAWLESGRLQVRFKGAARPGDRVTTWGRIVKEEPLSQGRRTHCQVALRHAGSGAELISGTAAVLAPGGAQ